MATLDLSTFSSSSRHVLERAQKFAQKRRHRYIEPVHVLIGILMSSKDTSGKKLLGDVGANADLVIQSLNDELNLLPRSYRKADTIHLSERLMQAINGAREWASREGMAEVTPSVLLVAIASLSKGPAGRILRQQGATAEALQNAMRSQGGVQSSARQLRRAGQDVPSTPLKIETLAKYGEDMTAKAEANAFDPVIGREDELRRIMQVLCRRTKNNPVLIGEPGVGKTAIVEALCQRVVAGDVPLGLKGRRIFSLTMASLRAGTSLRGQFEERVDAILSEIKNSNGRVIVYIDEVHSIVASGGEGNDTASILKPALARGDLRCIGTTTAAEYKQYIEEDKALVRRFQEIPVGEPEIDQAIAILRGIKQKYEIHHGVRITDAAIVAAVRFADRYLTDRKLPDTAIDLI
ncbi:MAG: ATP-dependent Clp protease ATP-binding subunit, partial [Myxococcota bacterium]